MDTIASLVTKPINQNVGIIRISGPLTFEIIKKIYPKIKIIPNTVIFKKLFINNFFIDDTLVLFFKSPNSFTGEDLIEIQFHGSIFVAKKILNFIFKNGIRQSKPGEFMKQAIINGKIDLTKAESINALINSENEKIFNNLSKNINGEQKKFIFNLIKKVNDLIARIQVSIDYPENTDIPKYNLKSFLIDIKKIEKEINEVSLKSKRIFKINDGIKISIIGRPNSGKSSLFNNLLDEQKSIISDKKGTTRDVVEGNVYINGVKILFQDTAGIRKNTKDEIEKIGIEKAKKTALNSDIIILLINPLENIKSQIEEFKYFFSYKEKLIPVISKKDLLLKQENNNFIKISSLKNDISELEKEIDEKIEKTYFKSLENLPYLITNNQITIFEEIYELILNVKKLIKEKNYDDLVFLELQEIIKKLNLLIGEEIDENYFNDLFKNFCIGK